MTSFKTYKTLDYNTVVDKKTVKSGSFRKRLRLHGP